MKIYAETHWLRWICFGGWFLAIFGIILKGIRIDMMQKFDWFMLLAGIGFGVCLLNGVVAELEIGLTIPLFEIGSVIMQVAILAGIISLLTRRFGLPKGIKDAQNK